MRANTRNRRAEFWRRRRVLVEDRGRRGFRPRPRTPRDRRRSARCPRPRRPPRGRPRGRARGRSRSGTLGDPREGRGVEPRRPGPRGEHVPRGVPGVPGVPDRPPIVPVPNEDEIHASAVRCPRCASSSRHVARAARASHPSRRPIGPRWLTLETATTSPSSAARIPASSPRILPGDDLSREATTRERSYRTDALASASPGSVASAATEPACPSRSAARHPARPRRKCRNPSRRSRRDRRARASRTSPTRGGRAPWNRAVGFCDRS